MYFLNNSRNLSQRSFRRHLYCSIFAIIFQQKETISGLIFFLGFAIESLITIFNMEEFTNNHNVGLYGTDSALIFHALLIEVFLLGSV